MTQSRSRRKVTSANVRVNESCTQALIDGVLSLSSDPKTDYLKDVFLDKYVSQDTAPPNVRRQRAINKWLATERNNEATNVRLIITHSDFQILPNVSFRSFVDKAQSITASIVDPIPDFASLIGGFSGGATTSRKRTESHPAGKYLGQADVTNDALPLFQDLLPEMAVWDSLKDGLSLRVVPGNVLFTVPKNTEIDRVACKEPDINMFMQKGLGSAIRRSLKRIGINLNDQSRNKELARQGSITNKLATLDLSSASDSVSRELVWLLMPPFWFTLLDAIRSKITMIDGTEHRNEMFSSMGNGFTFELESLLFYVLARTTAYFTGISGVISVYGDDLIVPSALFHDLEWILSYFGFEVNTKKSFWDGPFRESCGGHFISGQDVTPFYLRSPIKNLTDLIHSANMLRKWSEESIGINNPEVYPLWRKLADQVPKSLWGGSEYSSKLQLVSPHKAKQTLWPKVTSFNTGSGGYIHWLNSTMTRERAYEHVVTSEATTTTQLFRLRRVKGMVARIRDLFLEEIFDAE